MRLPTHTDRRRARGAVALCVVLAMGLLGCGDDDGDGGEPSSTTTDSTITTMAPSATGDIGNETVPGQEDDSTGGTDTTVSGAVPGQSDDQLNPPSTEVRPDDGY